MPPLPAIAFLGVPLPDRAAFDRAMALVKDEMSPAQVRSLLGPPDDVWTPADSSLYARAGETVWCYGSQGHLSLPTLGQIRFRHDKAFVDNFGMVHELMGGRPWQPIPHLPPEAELRRLLRAIHLPPTRQRTYDPLWAIRTANLLRPFGRERALAVLTQYARLQQGSADFGTDLHWLALLLFKGASLKSGARGLFPPPPPDPRIWPTFPLAIVDGVPFCFYQGNVMTGPRFSVEAYFAYGSKHWTLKPEPLRPPDDPFLAFKRLRTGFARNYPGLDPQRYAPGAFRVQFQSLLWLVREVYPIDFPGHETSDTFEAHHAGFLRTGARWDERLGRYVRPDRTWTTSVEPRYPVVSATVETPGPDVDFTIERTGANRGHCHVEVGVGEVASKLICRIVNVRPRRDQYRYQLEATSNSSNSWSWEAPAGWVIVFEVTYEGKEYRSREIRV